MSFWLTNYNVTIHLTKKMLVYCNAIKSKHLLKYFITCTEQHLHICFFNSFFKLKSGSFLALAKNERKCICNFSDMLFWFGYFSIWNQYSVQLLFFLKIRKKIEKGEKQSNTYCIFWQTITVKSVSQILPITKIHTHSSANPGIYD